MAAVSAQWNTAILIERNIMAKDDDIHFQAQAASDQAALAGQATVPAMA